MKKLIFFLSFMLVAVVSVIAQDSTIAVTDVSAFDGDVPTPAEWTSDLYIGILLTLVTGIITYFSKLFPVLGNIPEIKVRAFVIAAIATTGAIYYKGDFIGADTLPFLISAVLTIVSAFGIAGSSGLLYDLIKFFTGGKIKSLN